MTFLKRRLSTFMPWVLPMAFMISPLSQADQPGIVPLPKEIKLGEGTKEVHATSVVYYDVAAAKVAAIFVADFKARTKREVKYVKRDMSNSSLPGIHLTLDITLGTQAEGYKLLANSKNITIAGKDAAGLFWGTRTLLQLMPPVNDVAWEKNSVTIPSLAILDEPRFVWRGAMLDVARSFFTIAELKRFIDEMAFHKLNVFHCHLTDDQGWRLEIKKYPKLTTVGATRHGTPPYGSRRGNDGIVTRGFYTQAEVREFVKYAADRFITVVPEIDLPGHMSAAITAYPELGNDDAPGFAPMVSSTWGVHYYTLSPKPTTFTFLENVLDEVCQMFPSKIIHIGGDEVPRDQWLGSPKTQEIAKKRELKDANGIQGLFIQEVGKMLKKRGRRLIGWDDIRDGGLDADAIVMSWRGNSAAESIKDGNDVVAAHADYLYLDYYQHPKNEELAKGVEFECIGHHNSLEKVYGFEPMPAGATPQQQKHLIGTEGVIWGEYTHTFDKAEYLAFPRLAALAESAWSPPRKEELCGIRGTLTQHYQTL